MPNSRRPQSYPIDKLPPIHPGDFLRDELKALNMSARKFSEHIRTSSNAASGIISHQRSISPDMAIRLGLAFGTTPDYWMNLQKMYDLKCAQREIGDDVKTIERLILPESPKHD